MGLSLPEHQNGGTGWANAPSFCAALTPLLPGLICEMLSCVEHSHDLWAASSGNPSPGSLLSLLSTEALNIQPDWGCAAAGTLRVRVVLASQFTFSKP